MSLVLDRTSLDARYFDRRGALQQVDRVDVVGSVACRFIPNGVRGQRPSPEDTSLRHRDFISPSQQALIAETTFGIVGCGGLGSIAAEALLRLGARNFILFDHDDVEAHNLNRWQGGRPSDVRKNKAELKARSLRGMGGHGAVNAKAVPLSVLDPKAMPYLTSCDVVVGCLDNALARYFLSRFAVQYLVPLFDAGVNIVAGSNVDFQDRYFAVVPGVSACAECTGYEVLDLAEVDRDLMVDITAEARRAAGYVEDRPEIAGAASAYALNMRAVSMLMLELSNWFCGWRPFATTAAEWWSAGRYQRSDRANHPEPPGSGCVTCTTLLGAGDAAELPRPLAPGHAARILAEARQHVLSASSSSVQS